MQQDRTNFFQKITELLEKLEQKSNDPNPATLAFIAVQLLFLVLALVSLHNFASEKTAIESNSPTVSQVALANPGVLKYTGGQLETIKKELFRLVEVNTENAASFKNPTAKIREDAIYRESFSSKNIEYLSFIVDIPDLEQSYQVFHEWSTIKDNPNALPNESVIVLCLEDSQKIYENFDCKDIYGQRTRTPRLFRYLAWHNFDGLFISYPDSTQQNIAVNVLGEKDDDEVAHIQEVKDYITTLGLNPEGPSYRVNYVTYLSD